MINIKLKLFASLIPNIHVETILIVQLRKYIKLTEKIEIMYASPYLISSNSDTLKHLHFKIR